MTGYKDCVLRINLNNGTIKKEKINAEYVKKFLGGEGYGIGLLWYEMPHNAKAFSPENILSFNTGPLTGTPTPSASRTSVVFISPLTNTIGASNMGSHFGAELKFAGYDSIVFEGASENPVYLYINNDTVELRNAEYLWGKDTRETTELLKNELGKEFKICCIGQAGEKLSKLACIFSDDCFAGRGGAGAVMGFKKIKAIAVKGEGSVEVFDKDRFLSVNKTAIKELRDETYTWGPVHGYGTLAWLDGANAYGILPTRNFLENSFADIESLLPYNIWNDKEKFKVNRRACYSCQLGCHKFVYMGKMEIGELEYETVSALGARCGVDSYEDIALAAYYTSIYGIDTISAGATVSTAMEWYEKGLIGKEDLDGLELNFGNGKSMAELIRKMGLREGAGDLFADGSFAAAKRIGGNAEDFVMAVKGMEISATDPRGSASMAIAFGTSERGACHMRPYSATIDAFGYLFSALDINEPKNPFDENESKEWLKAVKEYFVVTNLLGICDFNVINMEMSPITLAELYSAVTGIDTDKVELLKKAERTIALERSINYLRGFTRKDDRLPQRFINEPAPYGPPKGRVVDMDTALDRYYEACGYDKEKAIPKYEKYIELDMEDIAINVLR
ncbi:aldehyde ferredoxin oxidoreductase family protein [Caloramator quimbayensis]|nr:aldehyde ferredoxin oxidoreductase family protein [Caloramator quimbayensis]